MLLFILLVACMMQAQTAFRLNDNQKKKITRIDSEVLNTILWVEHRLNSNKNNTIDKIQDPLIGSIDKIIFKQNLSQKQVKDIYENCCIECYKTEWNLQIKKKADIEIKNNFRNDSLRSVKELAYENKINQQKKIEVLQKLKSDSLSKINIDSASPYEKLQRSLLAFSNNRFLTVFRKIDHNFSTINFSTYLQLDMGLSSKDFKIVNGKIVEKFIPKASKDNEYLKVEYSIIKKNDIIGAFTSEDVNIITGVEITGTPDLLIKLFLNYWPGDVKFSGYKKGEIANKQLLGDFIVFTGVSNNNYKIVIKKGNMDVDYESTYGINKKK